MCVEVVKGKVILPESQRAIERNRGVHASIKGWYKREYAYRCKQDKSERIEQKGDQASWLVDPERQAELNQSG